MRKTIVGLAAVGAVVGLLPVAMRVTRRLRAHSGLMAAHCKAMAAHCRQMATEVGGCGEAVGKA